MSDAVLRWWRHPADPVQQTVDASPWTYTNASTAVQLVTVVGIVTGIELNTGTGFGPSLLTAFTLAPGQAIRVSYIIVPPVVVVIQL